MHMQAAGHGDLDDVIHLEQVVGMLFIGAGEQRRLGPRFDFFAGRGYQEGDLVEFAESAPPLGAQIDEPQPGWLRGGFRAQGDTVAIDDVQFEPGIDVQARPRAEPLLHELFVGRFDGIAAGENGIVPFSVRARRGTAQHDGEQFHARASGAAGRRAFSARTSARLTS